LLDACEAAARAGGAQRLVLDTTHAMSQAARLYERAGFLRDDTQIRGSRCSIGYRKELAREE
jgi:ribosomal protein S18 acetylase RimI-like enzyme